MTFDLRVLKIDLRYDCIVLQTYKLIQLSLTKFKAVVLDIQNYIFLTWN